MTDRERAIKYRKEARRYKRKYRELIRAVENIKAEIQHQIDIEEYGVISDMVYEDGLEGALEIINKHTEGNNGKTI